MAVDLSSAHLRLTIAETIQFVGLRDTFQAASGSAERRGRRLPQR